MRTAVRQLHPQLRWLLVSRQANYHWAASPDSEVVSKPEFEMASPTSEGSSDLLWHRHAKALIGGLAALIVLCTGAAYLVVLAGSTPVTPYQERLAKQMLQNPTRATLHLGHYGDSTSWGAHLPTDCAVQDGMAIIPETLDDKARSSLGLESGEVPVLVYAPDGRNLLGRSGYPYDRIVTSNEWFLYKCRPILTHPRWWECGLQFANR